MVSQTTETGLAGRDVILDWYFQTVPNQEGCAKSEARHIVYAGTSLATKAINLLCIIRYRIAFYSALPLKRLFLTVKASFENLNRTLVLAPPWPSADSLEYACTGHVANGGTTGFTGHEPTAGHSRRPGECSTCTFCYPARYGR